MFSVRLFVALTSALSALLLQASRYMSVVSNRAAYVRCGKGGGMRTGKHGGYNRACAANAMPM